MTIKIYLAFFYAAYDNWVALNAVAIAATRNSC